jgi:hypothetical protein
MHLFAMGCRRGEISRNDIIYSWSVFGEVITATAPDGRQKKMHVGRDARRSVAKILARELEDEKSKIEENLIEPVLCQKL